MSKQYGLIIPGKEVKSTAIPVQQRAISKPSIFNESSDDDGSDDNNAADVPKLQRRDAPVAAAGLMERRLARNIQEKALKEDPTVFQYDELFDDMESKREEEKTVKSKEPKKPKYIGRLMECAERRKLENELRVERQVQKEREQEGEEFKDKESFVTAAYRKKLEEMRKLQEQEKRDEYLEAIGDVTKQKDLDGFYRHIFEQKTGSVKPVEKPGIQNTTAGDNEIIAYKPIKSGKPQQRAYRKRHSSEDDDEVNVATSATTSNAKKMHLQNNIDADSDFSIDSSSSSGEDDDEEPNETKRAGNNDGKTESKQNKSRTAKDGKQPELDATKLALQLDTMKKEKQDAAKESADFKMPKSPTAPVTTPKPKIDKSEIWKKRTVGAVFDAAVQRYYERKAARCA